MFFIVNKTKKPISLSDINITLGPRQAMDLDKVMDRSKSEKSLSLRAAKSNGDVEVRVQDKSKPKVSSPSKNKSNISGDLKEFKKEILGEMKELLKGQGGGVSKEDLQALINAMPKSQETVIIRQEGEKTREDEDVEMDEDMLGEINKRAVEKIVKDTKVESVNYKEKQEENTILNNVDQLEDLLG